LAGRGDGLLSWAYAVGGVATALALTGGNGRFVPWVGATLFQYEGMGLIAGGVALTLAGLGLDVLEEAWRSAEGKRRNRIAVVLAACGLGLVSVAGLAFPLLGVQAYPWPILALPLYLTVLTYGVLRYDLVAGFREEALRDLERRQAEAERRRLAELGALAATVAHDLRNPMNIVAMAVADADPAVRQEVKTQLARMDALVRDLLDYAKPWAVAPQDMDLFSAVASVVRDPAVFVDVPAGLVVRADPLRLSQALSNLLANATAAGGKVSVLAEAVQGAVIVHVCDDGPGVPDDIRESLFQPFVSRGAGGTGLGLAIVAKVMAAHGGSVTLGARDSWPTCFTLRFPA
jgi:signal transduction histidine kinase